MKLCTKNACTDTCVVQYNMDFETSVVYAWLYHMHVQETSFPYLRSLAITHNTSMYDNIIIITQRVQGGNVMTNNIIICPTAFTLHSFIKL